jgi:3-hydroxyacyl-CoA dehydrogenase/enoyl-CoA hydratase/3-hydroxybutyryl-CoA epimerase/3-hydroxyacyl-CoA dehydrogenase/enoyl-CoA hydratase/3-hydroxybutyryl-CoA epimerase/enoyl-CoA isomerase
MPVPSSLSLSFPQPQFALLTFDLPGKSANVLSQAVMQELAAALDTLRTTPGLQGVVIASGKPGTFIAGADIREFVPLMDDPARVAELCRHGQEILKQLAELPLLTIAAIDGACLGGGLELALACDRRIVSTNPKTQLGLPEVKLGLIPGWGGCGRLPRLIGLAPAMAMITSSNSLSGDAAVSQGLADESAPAAQLVDVALAMIQREQATMTYVADRERRRVPLGMADVEVEFARFAASSKLPAEFKHQPAAATAIQLLADTAQLNLDQALERETAAFQELFGSPANRALVHVFFLQDYNKHDHAATKSQPAAESISVLGAGVMGIGIAAAGLKAGLRVRLGDANTDALSRAAESSLQEATFDPNTKSADPKKLVSYGARLSGVTTNEELAASDAVIEAITENIDIKLPVLRRIEERLGQNAILASNTSTIPISRIARGLARPERFCGMHFFNPVRSMRLVEIIRGEQTSDETIATAVALVRRLGKFPIVVADGPGFLVNRLLSPYLNEAIELLHEGNSPRAIDDAALEFGMPIGPLALYDLIGLDTAMYAGRTMWEAFPERIRASPILPAFIKRERLGRKNGLGFYAYPNKAAEPQDDAAANQLVRNYLRQDKPSDATQIQDRLLLAMLLEACRVLSEGRVHDARDIDLGVIFGLGFPAFRGGILHWAQQLGGDAILRKLEPLRGTAARFEPPVMLLDWATGRRSHLTS